MQPPYSALRKRLTEYLEIDDSEWADIAARLKVRRYARKEIILQPGEKETCFRFVKEGIIHKYHVTEDQTIDVAIPGQFMADIVSLFNDSDTQNGIQSIHFSLIYELNFEDAKTIMQKHPRLQIIQNKALIQYAQACEKTTLFFRSDSVKDRIIDFIENNRELIQIVPQTYLSKLLKVRPETYSRIKGIMANRKKTKP